MNHTMALVGEHHETRKFALELASGTLPVTVWQPSPIHLGFRPFLMKEDMVIGELAIGVLVLARQQGIPIEPLDFGLVLGDPAQRLVVREDSVIRDMPDLVGCTIGARSFAMTSALWLRRYLDRMYGLPSCRFRWVTYEAEHVVETDLPEYVSRAPREAQLLSDLFLGRVDAIIAPPAALPIPGTRSVRVQSGDMTSEWITQLDLLPYHHVVCMRATALPRFGDRMRVALERSYDTAIHEGWRGPWDTGGVHEARVRDAIREVSIQCVSDGLVRSV